MRCGATFRPVFVVLALCALGASPDGQLVTPRARRAIDEGTAFLLRTQNPDGSWYSDGATGRFPTAVTALSGLALLGGGSTCYTGPHADRVRRAVEYLLQQSDPETGLIGGDEAGRPMFGHGFAMLFLAEVYGSEGQTALRERIRAVLLDAIRLTTTAQSERGGWYYTPESPDDEGAVTMTQLQGLRACANAGLPVPRGTVEQAMNYIRLSAQPDGGIAYKIDRPMDSRPAISAAAVATMYAAGIYEGDVVEGAFEFARTNISTTAPQPAGGAHFFYAHMYLSQVMYFRGGARWRAYFGELRDWLIGVQRPDGSWNGDYIGTAYGTAVALLILQLPYNNLPVLQP
ncbi:MAG: prenyltransferase/squalene oxidase repeat-containing protein [Candidatus Brocadiia bacterium]